MSRRRSSYTGSGLLTDKQFQRLRDLVGVQAHVQVEATWGVYQRMIEAYREPDPTTGKALMAKLIEDLSTGVPPVLVEGDCCTDR